VIFDMTISVSAGIVLAALLFMQRMSNMFHAELDDSHHAQLKDPGLEGVIVYSIRGPLFFGAAEKAVSTLARVRSKTKVVILQMDDVPVMDISGLVALESAIQRLHKAGIFVAIAGVQAQPREVLEKGGVRSDFARLAVCDTGDEAIEVVRQHLGLPATA
jgi:SulP family sulfate permease